jgi:MFS family permease
VVTGGVASAYFLTQAGFMLFFGQLLTFACVWFFLHIWNLMVIHSTTKWVYMILIFIFELGSLLCGVAPTMKVFILGRAVAGIGGAGIVVSSTLLSLFCRFPELTGCVFSSHHLGTNYSP